MFHKNQRHSTRALQKKAKKKPKKDIHRNAFDANFHIHG